MSSRVSLQRRALPNGAVVTLARLRETERERENTTFLEVDDGKHIHAFFSSKRFLSRGSLSSPTPYPPIPEQCKRMGHYLS